MIQVHRPAAFGLLLFAACQIVMAKAVVAPPLPAAAAVQPIALKEAASEPIALGDVIFRIETGTVLGHFYRIGRSKPVTDDRWPASAGRSREFDVAIMNRLRELGYTIVDPSDNPFRSVEPAKSRYRLGAIVSRISRDHYFRYTGEYISMPDEGYGIADADVEFQILENSTEEIVFRKTYTGYGVEAGKRPVPLIPAIINALDHALSDPGFVSAVRSDKNGTPGTGPADSAATLRVPACPASGDTRLPDNLSRISGSVVTLRVGSFSGSGVIVSTLGHVLTAAHVVTGASRVSAILPTGMEFDAAVLRVDVPHDVALLQLPGKGYPCVAVARAHTLKPGEEVFVIGSPLGKTFATSVSRGVLSGEREIEGVRYLQTDASVNPGSSGGPLLDKTGRVQAIVSLKIVAPAVEGLAFGVPVDVLAKSLAVTFD